MTIFASILMLAITRAELIERFNSPIITRADGLIQVHASCPEDMRNEFQLPVAKFADDAVSTLYSGLAIKSERQSTPGIVITIGSVRTNRTDVITSVVTNGEHVVTRIYLPSPGYVDLYRFKLDVIKGFFRYVKGEDISDDEAIDRFRLADPELRIEEARMQREEWLWLGKGDDEEGVKMMQKIIKPGTAFRRDVLTFASRLYLYPPQYDLTFVGKFKSLSFREALEYAAIDPSIRIVAFFKAKEMPVFGGGKGAALKAAAEAYRKFLDELAKGEMELDELKDLLESADTLLNIAYEEACKYDKKDHNR